MGVFGRGYNILETRKFPLGGSGGFLLASPGSRERPLTFGEFYFGVCAVVGSLCPLILI